jgi:glutathione synthase/RimK-type ligase-like ATP-grasp enzyme
MPMPGTVLILADEDDTHAKVVAVKLWEEHRLKSTVWSFARFPCDERLSFGLANGNGLEARGAPFAPGVDEIHSVWWRRPGYATASADIKDERVRRFARGEAEQFLTGVLESIGVPIINNPGRQHSASRKPLQLKSAVDVGLKIPKTLLSNDPDQIRNFWTKLGGRCIYKAFSSPYWTALETRRMTSDDLASLQNAALSPIIVQEEIERICDIRVNIFASELFACKVVPEHPIASVDSRFDLTAVWEPLTLPSDVANKLRALMELLQLDYGCIDMRLHPNGDFVFFEINPAGQFLFAEIDTGQPLSAAMARLLFEGSRFAH